MDAIFIIGIFISLFQFVLLLNKKSKSLPDKILTFWMLIIGIHLFSTHLYQQGYWEIYPHLIGITAPFPLFYGPMLYLYVSHSLKNEKQLSKMDFLHLSPVLLSYLYMGRFYFFYTVEEKRLVDAGELDDFQFFSGLLLFGIIVSGITYAIVSYRKLTKYASLLENNLSSTERMDLNWLKGLIWGVAILFTLIMFFIMTRDLMELNPGFNAEYIIYSTIILGILTLGYFGIRHQNIFSDNNTIIEIKDKGSYSKSGLKDTEAQEKHMELLQLMKDKKPYLNSKLSLTALANHLDTSPNHLSQIINQFEEKNFNDFVNLYRVEEFIHLASENKNYSLLALALEAGFNSKSTFNKLFKKYKGITPSQFLALEKA